jgi:branched-chain amino acid transport system substrate-binding protein
MWARSCSYAGLVVAVAALVGGCGGRSEQPFKVAVIAFCDQRINNLAFQQDRSDAGAELPFLRRGAKLRGQEPSGGITDVAVGGRRVELLLGCSGFGQWASDLDQVRRLVEVQHADAIVLPLSVDVGVALEPYVRAHPGVTFFLPSPFEQTPTLKRPPPNLFRFELDGPETAAGLGTYAYRTLGWRRAVTVGPSEPSEWPQVAGFVAEFCSLGGDVVQRLWGAPGSPNYPALLRQLRASKVDGLYFTGGVNGETTSLANALRARYPDLARHLLVGTFSLFFDQGPAWLGVVGGSGFPYGSPSSAWRSYTADLKRLTGESSFLLDTSYFNQTEALLEALERVHGDTSHGERRLQQALARLRLASPRGTVTLDARHQAVGETYLGRLQRNARGRLFVKQIRVVPGVEATFNGYFGPTTPPPGPTQPTCRHGSPPRWSR